ncbi:anti-sigma factor antagonist [Azospirillum brasilense]|uniref:Anti-sigma factor antagonist n=1 Tax=Azospirillum brasilense TaxID=192 RepID=A0A0P0E838_AZOBR|nr:MULTISPECIES: STAS domain-containing protein [Azospirillum]ALJ34361.1 anti-anti-sigma factor [Azospirillum brasilense]MDW7556396.1 STAS domain-containing protein [Azospirillum brasilense]MDW7596192.1 STAS domain-containing protein [Azospirillum brasilense]MDW7631159.1 STAS domain-containing protein [Azospirillum brasilense]MDX5952970.1 STAS domain-containing protein [Azospirillum brasilense]
MDYGIEDKEQETLVRLRGRLTFNDHAKLRALIREMLQNKAKRQVLDLATLEFVDSAGIGMLLIAREEMANADKQLVLRSAAGQVKRVLTVAQLNKIVTIED